MNAADRALLTENKELLMDAIAEEHKTRGESERTDLLFLQLGIVAWWLERHMGEMPVAVREKATEGVDVLRQLRQQRKSAGLPS